jgi:transcriptional regulator with XRE-family HTH domain
VGVAWNIDEHIGRKLRHRRRMLGLTQGQLGELCGVRLQQIQKYECAANHMSAGRLFILARVLDVPVSYFFDGFEEVARPEAAPHVGAF